MKQLTVAVVGAGSRGNAYSRYFQQFPEKGKVVAVAELREDYLSAFANEYDIPREMQFRDWSELADKDKLADAAFICTPERGHSEPASALAKKGYHLLLEQPMAPTLQLAIQIIKHQVRQ